MKTILLLIILIFPACLLSQHLVDTTYNPTLQNPEYKSGEGPLIFIDEGHYNFHTMDGRYKPFATLLERDGYNIRGYEGVFKKDKLAKAKILVISNALSEDVEDWVIPDPSAFTKSEIDAVRQWVYEGGSLFLIADHMPMADAAKDLAGAFEFEFTNGFVFDTLSRGIAYFKLQDNTLIASIITTGRDSTESVEEIVSFTGQAIKIPDDATSILTFNSAFVNFLPDTSWVFDDNTTKLSVEGWSQGAFKRYGKGKVVVFGEAAMFTAQLAGPEKRKGGMNSDYAHENYQLLLNIIHWLDGKLE